MNDSSHAWSRRDWLAFAMAALAARRSAAQPAYPSRPITIVVPFAPGGIADITARAVAQAMQTTLGQSVVVDNRPSAGSIVATSAVAHAPADGYTLLLLSNGNAVSAGLFRKLPFDVTKDFAPIATLGYFDLALFVGAASRHRSLGELVAYARAHPGKLTIGSINVGSTQQLAAELFKTTAGIDAVIVPYKGTPAVVTALRAGEVDVAVEILGPLLPQVQAQAIRALAVAAPERLPVLPDAPTVREAGIADYAVASWNGLAAPAGTPASVIARLNRAANEAVQSPAVRAQLQALGVRTQGSTPAQLQTLLASEIARWAGVIKAAGIAPQ